MPRSYYYVRPAQVIGPIGARELVQLAREGKLQPSDLVAKDRPSKFRVAGEIRGLIFSDIQEAQALTGPRAAAADDEISLFDRLEPAPTFRARPKRPSVPPRGAATLIAASLTVLAPRSETIARGGKGAVPAEKRPLPSSPLMPPAACYTTHTGE